MVKLKALLTSLFLFCVCGHALALNSSAIPQKFSIPFANSAPNSATAPGGANYPVPTPSQVGTTNCAASLTTGFPPNSMLPVSAGGCAPFGQDFNGILLQISAWSRWQSAGAAVPWDSTFSTAIGGYPNGAIVQSATTTGLWWLSTADNNTTNPDTGGAGWQGLGIGVPTGSLVAFAGSTAPPGYFLANGQAVSRTTYSALFAVIGTTYGVGDGSTTFNVPDLRGRVPAGNDTMSASAANRLTTAGSGCAGSTTGTGCGSQNQTVAQANLPNVNFSFTLTAQPQTTTTELNGTPTTTLWGSGTQGLQGGGIINSLIGIGTASIVNSTSSVTGTISSGGSGTAVPTVPPTLVANYIIKY